VLVVVAEAAMVIRMTVVALVVVVAEAAMVIRVTVVALVVVVDSHLQLSVA
jgi:hypothetical protein